MEPMPARPDAPDDARPEIAAQLLVDLFPRVHRIIVEALHEAPHTAGMTLVQFRVLARLSERDHRAGELADRLEVTRPALTAITDVLEERGLVERLRGLAEDRRGVRLRLTPAGRALYRSLKARAVAALALLTSSLAPADRAALVAGLDALQRSLRGSGPGPHRSPEEEAE